MEKNDNTTAFIQFSAHILLSIYCNADDNYVKVYLEKPFTIDCVYRSNTSIAWKRQIHIEFPMTDVILVKIINMMHRIRLTFCCHVVHGAHYPARSIR